MQDIESEEMCSTKQKKQGPRTQESFNPLTYRSD